MIRSKKHYTITRSVLQRWEETLARERSRPLHPGEHPAMHKIKLAGIERQIAALSAELTAYDELVSGARSTLSLDSFNDIPRILISARLMAGMTQRELAGALGLPEQQIQRYESDGYATANIERICEVAEAIGIQFAVPATITIGGEQRSFAVPQTAGKPTTAKQPASPPAATSGEHSPGESKAHTGWGPRHGR